MLEHAVAASFCTRLEALQKSAPLDVYRLYLQCIDVSTVVMLCVCNSRLEHFLDQDGPFFGAELKNVQGPVNGQSADLVRDQPALLRREARAAQRCFGFHEHSVTSSAPQWAFPKSSCRPSGP